MAPPASWTLTRIPGADAYVDEAYGLADMQETFKNSAWAARIPAELEVPIETRVAEVVVRGRIDAIFRDDDGGWDLIDWKTGKVPSKAQLAVRGVQLAVYRLAWSRLKGCPWSRFVRRFTTWARTSSSVPWIWPARRNSKPSSPTPTQARPSSRLLLERDDLHGSGVQFRSRGRTVPLLLGFCAGSMRRQLLQRQLDSLLSVLVQPRQQFGADNLRSASRSVAVTGVQRQRSARLR